MRLFVVVESSFGIESHTTSGTFVLGFTRVSLFIVRQLLFLGLKFIPTKTAFELGCLVLMGSHVGQLRGLVIEYGATKVTRKFSLFNGWMGIFHMAIEVSTDLEFLLTLIALVDVRMSFFRVFVELLLGGKSFNTFCARYSFNGLTGMHSSVMPSQSVPID